MRLAGIDLGGTEIKGGILEEDGTLGELVRRPTQAAMGRETIAENLAAVAGSLVKASDVAAIGVGAAGTIDPAAGAVAFATDNLPGWTGFPIAAFLQSKFPLPVYADNDAYMALEGELYAGAAAGCRNAAMITVGTGIGGAWATEGKVFRGAGFSAGRWGHTLLHSGGRPCNCGQSGCAEQYVSGTAFVRGARALGRDISHGRQVFEAIKRGDRELSAYLDGYLQELRDLLFTVKNAADPDAILLGGGLMESAGSWWEERFLPMFAGCRVRILRAALGNRAGIIGAAHAAGEAFFP